jgi:hypothetical protein
MLRTIIPAASLALAAFVTLPAAASPLTVDNQGQFTDPSVSGTFRDVFTFSLGEAGIVNATYSGAPSALDVMDFGIYSGNTEVTTFQSYSFFNDVAGGTNSVELGAGNYTVQLAGTVSSGLAKYNGNIYVTAVPLPPAAALFGLSLILLAGVGARKNCFGRKSGSA